MKDVGIFSSRQWINESEIQMTSSSLLREIGRQKLSEVKSIQNKIKDGQHELREKVLPLVHEKESAFKSSILLIGYATELALKSGVVHFYRGLPKSLVLKGLKKYGHKLKEMAVDLGLPLSRDEAGFLKEMRDFIEEESRYPVNPEDETSYSETWNMLNRKLQDNSYYNEIGQLYQKIYDFVKKIDSDRNNPSSVWHSTIDQDGYLVYRFGGNIPSRATVRYSSEQIANNESDLESLKTTLNLHAIEYATLKHLLINWDNTVWFEHVSNDDLKRRS